MSRCSDCDSSRYIDFVGGVVLGAAIGAVAGILFAPYSGAETRKRLQKEGERVYKDVERKVKPVVENAKRAMDEKVTMLKSEVENTINDVKGKLKR